MIESREDDGRNDLTRIYSQPDEVGYWQPPALGAPATGGGMAVAWLGLRRPAGVHPYRRLDGPDALTSHAYAVDYEEVLETGSSTPTPALADEALTAQFFAFNPLVITASPCARC